MNTFEHFPQDTVCPICGKSDDRQCVLISIYGTQDGNLVQAAPTHTDCVIDSVAIVVERGIVVGVVNKDWQVSSHEEKRNYEVLTRDQMREIYEGGASIHELASRTGWSMSGIRRAIVERGGAIRGKGRILGKRVKKTT